MEGLLATAVAQIKFQLSRLSQRGDEIILATPAEDARFGSFYQRELEYMKGKGYTVSADGTRLLPPKE